MPKFDKIQESKAIWDLGMMRLEGEHWADAMNSFKNAQSLLNGVDPTESGMQNHIFKK